MITKSVIWNGVPPMPSEWWFVQKIDLNGMVGNKTCRPPQAWHLRKSSAEREAAKLSKKTGFTFEVIKCNSEVISTVRTITNIVWRDNEGRVIEESILE